MFSPLRDDVQHKSCLHITLLHIFYFWLFFTKKYAGIFGNAESFGSFSGGVGPEFLVTVQYILILVAVAGEDVGDQRLRILDQKAVFIRKPLSLWEKRR